MGKLANDLEEFVAKYLRDSLTEDRFNISIQEFKRLIREVKKEMREPRSNERSNR